MHWTFHGRKNVKRWFDEILVVIHVHVQLRCVYTSMLSAVTNKIIKASPTTNQAVILWDTNGTKSNTLMICMLNTLLNYPFCTDWLLTCENVHLFHNWIYMQVSKIYNIWMNNPTYRHIQSVRLCKIHARAEENTEQRGRCKLQHSDRLYLKLVDAEIVLCTRIHKHAVLVHFVIVIK